MNISKDIKSKALLQDLENRENVRNATGILKLIFQGEEDIKDGKSRPQEEVFAGIESMLKEQMK
jgi:hypothetical protein